MIHLDTEYCVYDSVTRTWQVDHSTILVAGYMDDHPNNRSFSRIFKEGSVIDLFNPRTGACCQFAWAGLLIKEWRILGATYEVNDYYSMFPSMTDSHFVVWS